MSAQSSQNTTQQTSGTSNTTSASNPSALALPSLTTALSGANTALGTTSQYTPQQLDAFTQMLNYGTSNGATPASSAAAGGALSSSGAAGAATGLTGLANFNPTATNNENANIAGGNQYVSGANIPGQVAADMVPAEQAAAYGLNPQIDQNAAGSGNINSSRDAIEHGVLATNLAQQSNALSSQLGANAFNTGVSTTANTNTANNSASLASLLGLTTGGATAANSGTAANAGSVSDASGLYNIAGAGASGQNNDPYQSLLNYFGIASSPSLGATSNSNTQQQGTVTGTTTSNPSALSQIGAWTNFAGSLL